MQTDVYYNLTDICEKWGERITGQICQNLLALALVEQGFEAQRMDVHNVEGLDIVMDDSKLGKYAIEVKTTSGETISLAAKDYKGLKKYSQKNYATILAVLKIDLFKDWIFADISKKEQKFNIKVSELYTADKYKELARETNEHFAKLVIENHKHILEKGSEFLNQKLLAKGIKCSTS